MRGYFFGARRNDPLKLVDTRPLPRYTSEECCTGDAAKDGFTIVTRSRPNAQGSSPYAAGIIGPTYSGPDNSFEQ